MFISQNGLNLIKEYEGCILQSYDDYNDRIVGPGGYFRGTGTIGFGHIEGVYPGQTITMQEAEDLLKSDMVEYCNQVQELIDDGTISFPVNQNSFDALVSFDYNLGQGNLRQLCRGRDINTVADKMLLYVNPGSVWEEGLRRRRTAERNLFLSDSEGGSPIQQAAPQVQANEVSQLQELLNAQGFRDKNGNALRIDGDPGKLTLSACPMVRQGANGQITQWIQLRVGANPDGDFGPNTCNAVKWFQQSRGLVADGVVGENTWKALLGI